MENSNISMVVRIPHASIIRFFVIHVEEYEGYAIWWNDGILRDVFNLDNKYPEDIFV
jgi:hypothetical protein